MVEATVQLGGDIEANKTRKLKEAYEELKEMYGEENHFSADPRRFTVILKLTAVNPSMKRRDSIKKERRRIVKRNFLKQCKGCPRQFVPQVGESTIWA